MNILLTGASGFIGKNIFNTLNKAGHKVIPISRYYGTDINQLLTVQDWLPYLEKMDAVINALGIIGESRSQTFKNLHSLAPVALFKACSLIGVNRVIQISALGTDETAFTDFHLSKRVADEFLQNSTLEWFVLKPALIYGKGSKSTDLMMKIARLPIIPILGKGQQRLQPVHICDVVATVNKALHSKNYKKTLNIVGPEHITFREWLQMMRRAQGLKSSKFISLPLTMMKLFFPIIKYINPIFNTDNLKMLQVGYSADVAPIKKFLGRQLMNIKEPLFFIDTNSDRCSL